MDNIDDLMRQKFEADIPAERFVFREEYWEQARTLLEEAEKEKRRRWLLLLLLVGTGLLGLLCFLASKHLSATANDMPAKVQPAQTAGTEKAAPLALAEQPASQPGNTSTGTGSTANHKGQPQENKKLGTKTSQVAATTSTASHMTAVGQTSAQNPIEPTAVAEAPSARPAPTTEAAPMALKTDLIAVSCEPLAWPAREQQPKAHPTPAAEKPTKIAKNKRLAMSLALARAEYRYPPAGNTLRSGGWAIGTRAEYKLSDKFALTTGLQWRTTPGYSASPSDSATGAFNVAELTTYSFGFKRHKWEYRTKALHFVEIPVGFQWKPAKWSLEAGGSVNILARVQNVEHYTLSTSLDQMAAERNTTKNGVKRLYTQAGYGAYAGIGYQFGKRMTSFVSGQYRFSPIFAPEIELPADGHLINLDFGLRYRFL